MDPRDPRQQANLGKISDHPEKPGQNAIIRSQARKNNWLVVLTCFNHLEKYERISHILWKIKNV
jgi:hypothetical protein